MSATETHKEGGDSERKESPPPIGGELEAQNKSFSDSGIIVPKMNNEDMQMKKPQQKPSHSNIKSTSDDHPVKENGVKPSSLPQDTSLGAGNIAERATEPPTSPISPQAKEACLEENQVEDTVNLATANTDDAESESVDEYPPLEDQKRHALSSDARAAQANHTYNPHGGQQTHNLEAKIAANLELQARRERELAEIGPEERRAAAATSASFDYRRRHGIDQKTPFPHLMYHLLEDDNYKDALCWLPDGLSFALDPDVFQRKVIEVHFPRSKFDSFKRKLNRWGFRRVMETEAPGTMTYFHRLFRRGYPGLLKQMHGGRIKSQKGLNMLSIEKKLNKAAAKQFQALQSTGDPAFLAAILNESLPGSIPFGLMGQGAGQPVMSAEGFSSNLIPPLEFDGMRGRAEMGRILFEQERLRLELAKKSQEEFELREKLNEESYRRRAQEEQMRKVLQTAPSSRMPPGFLSSQGLSSQMPFGMTERGSDLASNMFSTMSQDMLSSQFRQPGGALSRGDLYQESGAEHAQGSSISIRVPPPMPQENPPTEDNDEHSSSFRSLQQQQGQDFERLVQEEMVRQQQQAREQQFGQQFGQQSSGRTGEQD